MDNAEFRTERLLIRHLRLSDADQLVAVTNDIEIARHLVRTPHPYTRDDALALIARGMQLQSNVWAIEDSQLVGVIGLRGEFGFWLGKEFWGRGYATEAGAAIIDYGFEKFHFEHLNASPLCQNHRSQRVLDKLGFEKIGETSVFSIGQSKTVEALQMRLEKSRWRSIRADLRSA